MAKDCPQKSSQITSAATQITSATSNTPAPSASKITSAAQTLKTKKFTYTSNFKSIPQTKLEMKDTSSDHLLVATRINGHPAKTLVDHQTTGGDLISNKFCATHNLTLTPLPDPITVNLTIKGSKGVAHHYVIAEIDYNGHKETRSFYVVLLNYWDVVLGHPALKSHNAIITL